MELAIKIFQFILSISILVLLHELGHFLPAKWFKTRAEKFYLFFDPWFSLFSMKKINGKWKFRLISKNQPDTQIIEKDGKQVEVPIDLSTLPDNDWRKYPESTKYGIGWLPMGGYVKIAGMVDESMDLEQLKTPAKPWEFRSKPAWQRLIIMLGGVTVNFFLAWLIYSCLVYFKGEKYFDNSKFENGIAVSQEGQKMGLKSGDKIISIDGKPAERMQTSIVNMLFADEVTVQREGKEVTFPVNVDGVAEVLKSNEAKVYFSARFPSIVDSVANNSAAAKANLMKGDKIVKFNNIETPFHDKVQEVALQNKGKESTIEVIRNGQNLVFNITPEQDGKIGFSPNMLPLQEALLKTEVTKKYDFISAIPRGLEKTVDVLVMQIKQFKIIFNSKTEGYKKVSGPIGIINQMPGTIDWEFFWGFTAMFSVWLAFLNLLPIPGLDGGHVMFTLWEIITGKPVPQKVLENAQMIGVIFLLGLMILIFGNDIVKAITGKF